MTGGPSSIVYAFFSCAALMLHPAFLVVVGNCTIATWIAVIGCTCTSCVAQALVLGRYKYAKGYENPLTDHQRKRIASRRRNHHNNDARLVLLISVAMTHAALAVLEGYVAWIMVDDYVLSAPTKNYTAAAVGLAAVACQFLAYAGLFASNACMATCLGKLFCTLTLCGVFALAGWVFWNKIMIG